MFVIGSGLDKDVKIIHLDIVKVITVYVGEYQWQNAQLTKNNISCSCSEQEIETMIDKIFSTKYFPIHLFVCFSLCFYSFYLFTLSLFPSFIHSFIPTQQFSLNSKVIQACFDKRDNFTQA